ncbi:Alpha/Beta hydrolase protein [Trichophaea hybrida]|nr:Alpha/Beta hydrolase protein [Trichophaea hybrida]
MSSPQIHCASLNTTFKGVTTSDNVYQFRNIKFASIPQRFARSELVTSYEGGVVDATVHGPINPGRKVTPGLNLLQLIFALPSQYTVEYPTMDEKECLNFVITIPKERPSDELLPVFFNIVGGANTLAPAGIPLYDYTHLVESSIAQGKPIIAIHVPYRVALFGYGLLPNGAGGGNNALFDQRNAFEWVKRNISAFGGDPERITVGGESAGSFSVDCHLQAKDSIPYFKRAVLSSGTLRLLRPYTEETRLEFTQKVAAALGFEGEDWAERLIAAPKEDIMDAQEKLGLWCMNAVDDGEWFEKGIDMDKPVVPEWVESIMIGDCGFEGFLWVKHHLTTPASTIIKILEAHGELGKAILAVYPGFKPDVPQQVTLLSILSLLEDILFFHPNHALISAYKAAGKSVYQYLFDQNNPWSPATHKNHHGCDLLYWFNGYDLPTDKDQAVCDAMMRALIRYVNGEEPWGKDGAMAFGPDGVVGEISLEEAGKRRHGEVWEIFEKFSAEELLNLSDALVPVAHG